MKNQAHVRRFNSEKKGWIFHFLRWLIFQRSFSVFFNLNDLFQIRKNALTVSSLWTVGRYSVSLNWCDGVILDSGCVCHIKSRVRSICIINSEFWRRCWPSHYFARRLFATIVGKKRARLHYLCFRPRCERHLATLRKKIHCFSPLIRWDCRHVGN